MKTGELIDMLRFCADEGTTCMGCKRFSYRCGDWGCVEDLLSKAAEALEARNAGDALVPGWLPVRLTMPPMKTEKIEDGEDSIEYQESDTVLAYTTEGYMIAVKAITEGEKTYWVERDGTEYDVTHWMMVKPPKAVKK